MPRENTSRPSKPAVLREDAFLPDFLDSVVDYGTLAQAGSIMGSGGMVVLGRRHMHGRHGENISSPLQCWNRAESVFPVGGVLKQMLDILEDITSGKGKIEDIDLLIELGEAIKAGSLLRSRGIPYSPTRSFSTIRYFREEYEAHIKKLHCPAAVCKGLVKAPCSHTLSLQEWMSPATCAA